MQLGLVRNNAFRRKNMAYTLKQPLAPGEKYKTPLPTYPAPGTEPAAGGTQYNVSPNPTMGMGPFGRVPGQVGIPDVAAQLEQQLPGIGNINEAAAQGVLADLRGELAPSTVNAIQQAAAQWGAGAGVPGSGLAQQAGLRDIGLTAEAQRQKAMQNYAQLAGTVSQTQTVSPETQISTALQNAVNRASPDPGAAARYSESLFNKYVSRMNEPAISPIQQPQQNSMKLLRSGRMISSLADVGF
jgi:hypothetical protein